RGNNALACRYNFPLILRKQMRSLFDQVAERDDTGSQFFPFNDVIIRIKGDDNARQTFAGIGYFNNFLKQEGAPDQNGFTSTIVYNIFNRVFSQRRIDRYVDRTNLLY